MGKIDAFSLKEWIEEHRHLLKPPVGNQVVWEDSDFIVMIVGGPNNRKDFHVNPTEEFFYQLEGDVVLRIREDGEFRDVTIREGDVMLLPPMIPHSPRRGANTVGMVVERKRPEGQNDHFVFFCDNCNEVVFDHELYLVDIVKQLRPVMEGFWADEEKRCCEKCGSMVAPPVMDGN
ncbi:MAG TPA: 3-hydroxyanthranilate 3,4-dioxygenase [Planctomycetes bacterium]|nr:3-hydroxyanthranilate 3,4-dioxygenase [Planctomycetota bacterium]HIN80374.1 3-hydroxyanthranilate 3,4-dioxygenase [Planctomycetota bacterium]